MFHTGCLFLFSVEVRRCVVVKTAGFVLLPPQMDRNLVPRESFSRGIGGSVEVKICGGEDLWR